MIPVTDSDDMSCASRKSSNITECKFRSLHFVLTPVLFNGPN
jgi:hypothetical protein